MKSGRIGRLVLAGVLAVSSSVFAHHGNAAYDGTVVVLKDATVTKLVWANPHTLVLFDVKDEKGEVVHWNAELGSPSALANVGWTKASLQPGDIVTIHINQAKTKNPVGRIERIVLADGSQLTDSGGGGGGRRGAGPQ